MIKIVNHRGSNTRHPENTYPAAKASVHEGADYVELDIRESADSIPFVIHDYRLDRTTDGSGPVNTKSAKELEQMDAGSWFSPQFRGTRLPRFEEFMRFLSGKCGIQVELKATNFAKILGIIKTLNFAPDEVRFCTFTPDIFADMRHSSDPYPRLYYLEYSTDLDRHIEKDRVSILEVVEYKNFDESLVSACHQRGIQLQVFCDTVNAEHYRHIICSGADFINVDDTRLARAILAEEATAGRVV